MFNLFKKDKSETKALLASLYKMMMCDDLTRNEESKYFWMMCREKGLNQAEIEDVITRCSQESPSVPVCRQKQKAFLTDLASMMKIDGAIHPAEMALLKKYAEVMGLDETDLPA